MAPELPRATGDALPTRLAALIADRERATRAPEIADFRPVSGGNARAAFAFDVVWEDGSPPRACILLLQAKAGQLEQELGPEFDALSLLAGDEIPSPTPYWVDRDGTWLGSPGFVMERVAGEGDLRGLLDPAHRARNRAVALALARSAARLHGADWRARGFDALRVPEPERVALRQLDFWEELFEKHRMEPLPAVVDAFHWLRAHAPVARHVCIVHGDLRFGNVLYEDDSLTALLDWEMVHLGDPCEDLAWAYHPLWSPEPQLDFDSFVAAYRGSCDIEVPDDSLLFYRLFGEIKHAVISLTGARAFNRRETDNLRLADRMTWLPECLEQFYAWLPDLEQGS